MERLKKIIADSVFVAQVFILFILLFESRIEVPGVLQAFGRLHPALLHLPIGLLLVTVALFFAKKAFDSPATTALMSLLLHFTALTASFTTLMGLLLSLENTFGADQLMLHKWMGIALSFLCWGLLYLEHNITVLKPVGLAGVVLLIFTGHYGAMLTHGEDFVLAPLQGEPARVVRVITDSSSLYFAAVEPILESKCYGCHNERKAKGNLVLTSLEDIAEGGKNGPLWKAGDAANSLIVDRLSLPLDHKEHMPPKDKAQLSEDEIGLITLWIAEGADTDKPLKQFAEEDTLRKLAYTIMPRYQDSGIRQQYDFAFAPPDKIRQLSAPNRSVFQIARNEPAVQADFFLRETYEGRHLEELMAVKEQLISLNLSRMPVSDDDLKTISRFDNLEVINLNSTEIKGEGLAALASMPRLRSLSLSGTAVGVAHVKALGASKTLNEVFLWNTGVTPEEAAALEKQFPGVRWETGFIPDEDEVLKLNAPLLRNRTQVLAAGEAVTLKHNLPGTVMRYTTDGTDPDSVRSPVYEDPLQVGNYARIRTKAYKDGWLSSDVAEYFFFRKGIRPDSVLFVTPPDEKYPGEGAATLVDGEKGFPTFFRHPAWVAVRGKDLVFDFSFGENIPTVSNLTLSYAYNNGAMCLPPAEMQLWGGPAPDKLKQIAKATFTADQTPPRARIEGASMDIPPSQHRYYRLVARPMYEPKAKNPDRRTLWLMVDELFIN